MKFVYDSSKQPFISILIPTYNRKELLKETLNSVFNQTFKGLYEVVVVDDGSADGTWEYLKYWAKKEPRLKIFKHSINKGAASARNTAISLTKAQYFLFLDSDDKLLPEALEIFETKIKKHPEIKVFIGATLKENKKGNIRKITIPKITKDNFKNLKKFINGDFSGCLYMVKYDVLKNCFFPENLRVREDFVIKGWWIALHKVLAIKSPVGIIKDHPNRLRYKTHFYLSDTLASIDLLFQKLPLEFQKLYPYAKARAYIEIANKLYQAKDYKTALKYFNQAFKVYPKIFLNFKFFKKYFKTHIKNLFK